MEKKRKPKDPTDNRGPARMTDLESSFDPQGSYTGNPKGDGPWEKPVQDADDL